MNLEVVNRGHKSSGSPHYVGRHKCRTLTQSVAVGCCADGQLSEDELNSLIAHAHRRIEQLQKQIADHREAERHRQQSAVEQQKKENDRLSKERVERERDHFKSDLNLTRQKWVSFYHRFICQRVL